MNMRIFGKKESVSDFFMHCFMRWIRAYSVISDFLKGDLHHHLIVIMLVYITIIGIRMTIIILLLLSSILQESLK